MRPLSPLRRDRSIGIGLLLVASILWSLSGLAVKLAQMPPVSFAFYRSASASVLLLLLLPFSRGSAPPLRPMLATSIVYTIVVGFLITAMTRGTAAAGILLQYTAPAFCALFAWWFLKRRINRRTALSMAIALCGILVMILGSRIVSWVGPASGLVSGVAFGGLILLLQWVDRAADGPVNPIAIVLVNNTVAALLLLATGLSISTLALDARQLLIVSLTGSIQLAIPYVLFQLGLRRISPVDAALLVLLEPVLNPVWVAWFAGERPDTATLLGGGAILIALLIDATKASSEPG